MPDCRHLRRERESGRRTLSYRRRRFRQDLQAGRSAELSCDFHSVQQHRELLADSNSRSSFLFVDLSQYFHIIHLYSLCEYLDLMPPKKNLKLSAVRLCRFSDSRGGTSSPPMAAKAVRTNSSILHQNLTFRKLTDFFVGGTKCRPSIFPRQILSVRRADARLSARQDEVRLPCDLILSRVCFVK